MTGRRLLLHGFVLLLLPVVVAAFGLSLAAAAGLVLLMLLWRWVIALSAWAVPARVPALELETISASHFVEKVRWCMDRLGVDYREKAVGGTLGAFFLGRSVPVLRFRTGAVRSSIGNSPEILRYLWGRYAAEHPEQAEFLRPTPERLALEERIDRCGVDLQVWVYHHLLPERELTLQAWGANDPGLPGWQRWTLKLLFPILRFLIRRAFRITPRRHARAVEHLDTLLGETEAMLGDGRRSLLGGDEPNYTDFAFAAIMGLWAQPVPFGSGRADAVRVELERCPEAMQAEVERWKARYPLSSSFIDRLYEDYRR
jgi:glutathione S-transferase